MSAQAGKYRLVAVRYDAITKTDELGRPLAYTRFDQGDVVTLDEVEADRLVRAGAVVAVEDEDDEVDAEAEKPAGGEGPERPRPAGRLELWQEYAAAKGVATQDADGKDLTKDDLIAAVDAAEGK